MEYIRLGDIAEIGRGSSPRPITDQRYFVGGTIPWIKIADATASGKNIYQTKEHVNEYGASFSRKLPKGSLIIAASGTLGFPKFLGVEGCIHDGWMYFTNFNESKIDKHYLYYALIELGSYFNSISYGAAIQNINTPIVKKTRIELPPLPTQRRIASILSTYDSLIENNTRRIRLLEQMAENLYKEWFVRFRFPGHETYKMVDGPLGKLPSGFDVVKMKDVLDYYIGGGWGEEELSSDFSEDAFVIRGADFPNIKRFDTSSCPHRYHKISNYKTRQLEDGDIVLEISGGTQEQPVGRTVFVNQDLINRFENGKVICASFCKLIRPKKDAINPYFLFFWLQYLYDTRIITRFQLQSTGLINFKFEPFLRQCNVMVPPMDLQEEFAKQIASIYREMNNLASSSASLARQRDLLLPRLMSGKIEV